MHEISSRKRPVLYLGSSFLVLAGLIVLLAGTSGCGSKGKAGDEGQVGVRNESSAQTQNAPEANGVAESAPSTQEATPATGQAPATSVEGDTAAVGAGQLEGESTKPEPDAATPQKATGGEDSKTPRSGSGT